MLDNIYIYIYIYIYIIHFCVFVDESREDGPRGAKEVRLTMGEDVWLPRAQWLRCI